MFNIECHTNLDDFHTAVWPEETTIEPKMGHLIRAKGGQELYIVAITHVGYRAGVACEPYIILELYKDNPQIKRF